jgi:hypothetical protein
MNAFHLQSIDVVSDMALDRLIGIEPVTEVRLPLQAASQKAVSPEVYLLL